MQFLHLLKHGCSGHTLGGAVGLALVTAPPGILSASGFAGGNAAETVINKSFLSTGHWEVEIAGARFPVECSLAPMYDPNNKKIKG